MKFCQIQFLKEYLLRSVRSLYDVADNLQIRAQRGLVQEQTPNLDADDGQMLRFGRSGATI